MPWQCSLCVPRDSQASNALGKSPHCLNVILLFLVPLAIRFLFITKHVYVSLSVPPHLDIPKIYINPIAHALMSVAFHQFYLFFLLHCSLRPQQQSIELPWQTRETLVAFSLNSLVATAHHWAACPTLRNVGVHQSTKKRSGKKS